MKQFTKLLGRSNNPQLLRGLSLLPSHFVTFCLSLSQPFHYVISSVQRSTLYMILVLKVEVTTKLPTVMPTCTFQLNVTMEQIILWFKNTIGRPACNKTMLHNILQSKIGSFFIVLFVLFMLAQKYPPHFHPVHCKKVCCVWQKNQHNCLRIKKSASLHDV